MPNGSGEKAKGAILSRAVQYIHHLKENEARNIEKWTLEKLLMDQAMGDLQAQLEEMKRMWEEERVARQRVESELDVLKGLRSSGSAVPDAQQQQQQQRSGSPSPEVNPKPSPKRAASNRSAIAMPTAVAKPCPSGPVVVSIAGCSPCSGWPAAGEWSWRKRFNSSVPMPAWPVKCSSP